MPYTLSPDETYGLDVETTEYLKDHVKAPSANPKSTRERVPQPRENIQN